MSSLNPETIEEALKINQTFMVHKKDCPFGERAISLLTNENEVVYDSVDCSKLDNDFKQKHPAHATYPKIYYEGEFEGGNTDLKKVLGKENIKEEEIRSCPL